MIHTVPVLKALRTGARNTEKEIISGASVYFKLLFWSGNCFVFQNGMYRVKVPIASYLLHLKRGEKKSKEPYGFFSAFQQITEDFARLA